MLQAAMRASSFVGREHEVAQAREALVTARQGFGSVILLAGEAGIGKTSVAEEVSKAAAWLGMPAVWGPAIEAEGTPPFWCWRQVLQAMGKLFPNARVQDFAHPDSSTGLFAWFETVVEGIREAGERNGLLIVLDDLHWADSGSLRLLQVAAGRVPTSSLVILGTYREPEPGETSPLAHILPALLRERAVTRKVLHGLNATEAGSLVSQVLDTPASLSLVHRLVRQTDGNPFYLVELADMVRSGGLPNRLPARLGDVTMRRAALVSDSCRGVLASAAVIGRDFEVDLLALATGQDRDALLDELAQASKAGLTEEISFGRHRFKHALLREALYLGLAPAERAAWHARVADAIGGLGTPRRADYIDALAHHLRGSLPLKPVSEALAATLEAAQAAETRFGYEQAADLYQDAVALVNGDAAGTHSRAELLLKLGHCRYRAGEIAGAWEAAEAAAAAARGDGDTRALAAAALMVRGMVERSFARPLTSLCEEALRALKGAEPVLEARLLGEMSLASQEGWVVTGQPGLADRALEAARRAGDPEARFLALLGKEQEVWADPAQAQARLELSHEAVGVADEMGDPGLAVWAHAWRLGASWELGHRGEADTELAEMSAAAERCKEPLARWRLELARGTLALIDGRYGEALEAAEKAREIGERGGFTSRNEVSLVIRSMAVVRIGASAELEAELRKTMLVGQQRFWFATWLVDLGREDEVPEVWPGGAEAARPFYRMGLIGLMGMAKLAIAVRDGEWMAKLHEQLAPFTALNFVRAAIGGYEGPVALLAGRLASSLGQLEQAEQLLKKAVQVAAGIGSPPFEALARHELARLLQRRGRPRDRAAAVRLLRLAAATAELLGMRPLAGAVGADLQALEHPRGRATLLSERELEVARLVAEGLTNRAIAGRLHLSPRTAENHVKRILDKLGLESRAQIAAWSVAQAAKLST